MLKGLSPGAVGVHPRNLQHAIELASTHGFDAVEVNIAEVADLVDAEGAHAVRAMFGPIEPAGWGMPIDFRGEESTFNDGLLKLARFAAAGRAIGATRTFTWIMPGSNQRTFEENRKFHLERFKPISQVLGEHGCSFGLEFIGPKTLRDTQKHPFIYRMLDMMDLAKEAGPNMGLLLDCWHWYTSGGTVAEIESLSSRDVVYVHVNDAPAGVHVDQQVDSVRRLPGDTGVIDIAAFLRAIHKIGYGGPIVAEPFNKELEELATDDERLTRVNLSLDKILRSAGLERKQ